MRRWVTIVGSTLLISGVQAADRELATEGDKLTLSISEDYQCQPVAEIKATTKSAGYFDQDATVIQKKADAARFILNFNCPGLSTIHLKGFTDGVLVFKAESSKGKGWAIETDPAPLEGLALVFGRYEPHFYHLATFYDQLKPYEQVTGITDSYQYHIFEQEVLRLMAVIDGNTETFTDYLKNPGNHLGSFENATQHYQNILNTIERYAPNQLSAYQAAYDQLAGSLKSEYWASQIDTVLDKDQALSQSVSDIKVLSEGMESNEFIGFADAYLAKWLSAEAGYFKEGMVEAPLYEAAWFSDFLAGLPDSVDVSGFSKLAAQIDKTGQELLPGLLDRIASLIDVAEKAIQESGSTHRDIGAVLDTGFALAEEFEDAGYGEEAKYLLSKTLEHVDSVLEADLPAFKEELSNGELTAEQVASLREKAQLYEELAVDFEGFAAYKRAIEEALDSQRESICRGILENADVSSWEFDKKIHLGDELKSLVNFYM